MQFAEAWRTSMAIRRRRRDVSSTPARSAGNAQLARIGACTAKSSYLSVGKRYAANISELFNGPAKPRPVSRVGIPAGAIELRSIDVEHIGSEEPIFRWV